MTSSKKHANCLHAASSNAAITGFAPDLPEAAPPGTVGILGGIFDPVHCGHLAVARLAIDSFHFRRLLFVPSGKPPHKNAPGAGVNDRLSMLRIAIRGNRNYRIWDGEVRRKGCSYTIDTLDAIALLYPGCPLYFIIGSDNLTEIVTWRRYREILRRVTLCVALRPGYPATVPTRLSGSRIVFFPSPFWGISSTLIRAYLIHGLSCCHLVPEKVLEYISKKNLYRSY